MPDPRDDRPIVYSRAEPDDEYDQKPEPLDPFLTDNEETELDDEDELDEDEI